MQQSMCLSVTTNNTPVCDANAAPIDTSNSGGSEFSNNVPLFGGDSAGDADGDSTNDGDGGGVSGNCGDGAVGGDDAGDRAKNVDGRGE